MIIWLLLLGVCFGSFVNALVWRLHAQQRATRSTSSGRASKEQRAKLSILWGRSMCPNCKHELAVNDLIPLFSWLQLRGKCRYCHKKFDDTPFAELLVPALFVLSYVYWPFDWTTPAVAMFALWLAIIVGFVALAISDLRWYILPNRIVFPLQAIAVTLAVIGLVTVPESYSWLGVSLSLLLSAGLFWVLYHVSKGKWIGYGDVKLAVVIGLVLGRGELAFLMLFIASLLGTIVALPLMLVGKAGRKSHLPFGPFLIAATIIAYLFGMSLINWYKNMMLM